MCGCMCKFVLCEGREEEGKEREVKKGVREGESEELRIYTVLTLILKIKWE